MAPPPRAAFSLPTSSMHAPVCAGSRLGEVARPEFTRARAPALFQSRIVHSVHRTSSRFDSVCCGTTSAFVIAPIASSKARNASQASPSQSVVVLDAATRRAHIEDATAASVAFATASNLAKSAALCRGSDAACTTTGSVQSVSGSVVIKRAGGGSLWRDAVAKRLPG
jgi:hypothetical protein